MRSCILPLKREKAKAGGFCAVEWAGHRIHLRILCVLIVGSSLGASPAIPERKDIESAADERRASVPRFFAAQKNNWRIDIASPSPMPFHCCWSSRLSLPPCRLQVTPWIMSGVESPTTFCCIGCGRTLHHGVEYHLNVIVLHSRND